MRQTRHDCTSVKHTNLRGAGVAVAAAVTLGVAAGVVAAGVFAAGVVSAGVVAAGLVAAGVVSAGLVAAGLVAAGVVSAGLVAAGVVAAGVFQNKNSHKKHNAGTAQQQLCNSLLTLGRHCQYHLEALMHSDPAAQLPPDLQCTCHCLLTQATHSECIHRPKTMSHLTSKLQARLQAQQNAPCPAPSNQTGTWHDRSVY